MNKLIALLLILIIAPIIGGVYGILHDQITYSISNEYYTKFKFVQFGLQDWGICKNIGTPETPEIKSSNPRLCVSIVGLLATWWVGMIIGALLGLISLIHRSGKQMFSITMKSFLLTIGIAFAFGIVGLIYGKLFLSHHSSNWYFPDNLIDKTNYLLVGSMHNFSYIGGLIGMIISIIYSIEKRKTAK